MLQVIYNNGRPEYADSGHTGSLIATFQSKADAMQAMGLVKELRNLQGPNFAVKLQAHLQSKNKGENTRNFCGWSPKKEPAPDANLTREFRF